MHGDAQRDAARSSLTSTVGRLRYFVRYPVSLLLDPSVSSDAKVLAGILLHYDGPNGCFPAVKSLMQDLGCSKRTVLRSLEELARYGFLSRERGPRRKNRYRLHAVYDQPTRPSSIIRTGLLEIENDPVPRPLARHELDSQGAPAGTIAPSPKVPRRAPCMVPRRAPHSPSKVPRRAPPGYQEPRVIKNQQQQDAEAAAVDNAFRTGELLQELGIDRDESIRIAGEFSDLAPDRVAAAAKIMIGRQAYRRYEIRDLALYLRSVLDDLARRPQPLPAVAELPDRPDVAARHLAELDDAERARAESLAASRGGGPVELVVAAAQVRRERTAPAPDGNP